MFLVWVILKILNPSRKSLHNFSSLSIHFLPLIRGRVAVAAGSAGCSRYPSPKQRLPVPPGESQGNPRQDVICNLSCEFWVCPGVGSKGMCQVAEPSLCTEENYFRCLYPLLSFQFLMITRKTFPIVMMDIFWLVDVLTSCTSTTSMGESDVSDSTTVEESVPKRSHSNGADAVWLQTVVICKKCKTTVSKKMRQ